MINKDNLKIYTYEELKPLLPKESALHKLYEKAKDKSKFEVFFVYEGDIETDVLNISDDIWWATYYKFVNTKNVSSFFGPIILGNIKCNVISFSRVIIVGNIDTKNMSFMYSDIRNSFSELNGDLNVSEVLFATGKGIWGRKYNLSVSKKATIHTLINDEQPCIKCDNLSIQKTFDFPQIDFENGMRDTDWSKHTLEELKAHFNINSLKLDEYGKRVDCFFQERTKLCNQYLNYLSK